LHNKQIKIIKPYITPARSSKPYAIPTPRIKPYITPARSSKPYAIPTPRIKPYITPARSSKPYAIPTPRIKPYITPARSSKPYNFPKPSYKIPTNYKPPSPVRYKPTQNIITELMSTKKNKPHATTFDVDFQPGKIIKKNPIKTQKNKGFYIRSVFADVFDVWGKPDLITGFGIRGKIKRGSPK